jgi:hypothetical protein
MSVRGALTAVATKSAATAGGAAKGAATVGGVGLGASTTGLISPEKLAGVLGSAGSASAAQQIARIAVSPAIRQNLVRQGERLAATKITVSPPPAPATPSPTTSPPATVVVVQRPESSLDRVFRYGGYAVTAHQTIEVLRHFGLGSSGSKEIDAAVQKEIATSMLSGEKEHIVLVCRGANGEYPVPSDTLKCLNDTVPLALAKAIDFSSLRN